MSHAVKLVVFFIISVALHGAGLWAAAGRYEAREPDAPAGVAIVDRDLFFRHAERIETQASSPVTASDRITPRSAGTLRPSQPGESLARVPAAAAGEAEPERRVPASPAIGAMARLDLSTVDPAPTPRRESHTPDSTLPDHRTPERRSPVSPSAAIAPAEPERHTPASPSAPAMARLDLSIVEPAPPPRRDAMAPDGLDAARRAPERRTPVSPSAGIAPAEPERRAPAGPSASVMARLDLSTVEPTPPQRRDARTPDGLDAERRQRVRMSAVEATAPPAAARPQARASVPTPVPTRTTEALAPTGAARQASLVIAPPLRPAGDARQAARGPAPEPPARPAPDAARPGTIEALARAPAASLQAPAPAAPAITDVERGEAEAAPILSAAEAPRLAPPAPRAPADMAARDAIAPRPADRPDASMSAAAPTTDPTLATAAAPSAAAPAEAGDPTTAAPAQVRRDRPALRGTLPAPLLAARQPQPARSVDAPVASPLPARGEGLRLRPSLPDDFAPARATVAAAPAETMPAEPSAPPPMRASISPAPEPAPVATAAPRQLAAVAPQAPARRLESSDDPSGRNDPADRFTRAYQGGECFFPLRLASRNGASRDGASRDGAVIRGYGVQAESVDMFRQAFAKALGNDPQVDWRPLTDAQCGGISFTRLVLGDAAPSVRIALERRELELGQTLAGRVTGSRLEFVTLLVVDDSGVVHNVLDHLTPEGAELGFDIPVQPVDDGTDKVQLVMAVGASRPLPALESTTPVHSDDFFPALRDQAVDAGAVLELGLEDFVIRGGGT